MNNTRKPKPQEPEALYRLIVEVRGAFHDFADYADKMHSDLGITAATRAVMEHVAETGPDTVPNIARVKKVSRQHIQQLADALVDAGLATWKENPQHKRSKLLHLNGRGADRFAVVRKREAAALSTLAGQLDDLDVTSAARTLANVRGLLDGS